MRRYLTLAFIYCVLCCLFSPQAFALSRSLAGGDTTTQLPRHTKPTHYRISLVPNAASASFSANVAIDIDVLTTTSSITLNAADLTFYQIQLSPLAASTKANKNAKEAAQFNSVMLANSVIVDPLVQTATFEFAHPITPGSYALSIDYSGVIGTQANGLFSIDYASPSGAKRALYTQFEASDARRVFPSWDEPAYKATFTLDVTVPSDEMAVVTCHPCVRSNYLMRGSAFNSPLRRQCRLTYYFLEWVHLIAPLSMQMAPRSALSPRRTVASFLCVIGR